MMEVQVGIEGELRKCQDYNLEKVDCMPWCFAIVLCGSRELVKISGVMRDEKDDVLIPAQKVCESRP